MKAFLSYLRIFLLSLGLMHLQMLPVYAQAQTQSEVQAPSSSQQNTGTSGGGKFKTAKVVTDTGEEIGGDIMGQLVNMITMISIGMLGLVMYTYAPPTLDMKIAAAAAVAYIYGEVAALKATRDKMQAKEFVLTKYSNGSSDNMQRKALEEQKKSYESLADMLDQKAKMQQIASVGFFAAAAAALIFKAKLTALTASCLSAVPTIISASCASCPACPMCGPCTAAGTAVTGLQAKMEATEAAPMVSTAQVTAVLAEATTHDGSAAVCPAIAAACVPSTAFRKVVNTQSVIASMGAGLLVSALMRSLGLGSLSGLTSAIFLPISKAYDLAFATPVKRAIAFGALGALIMAGSAQSKGHAEKMRSNVKKIDEILNEMYLLQNVQPANLVATTRLDQTSLFAADNRSETDKLEAKSLPCPDGKDRNSEGNCNSLKKELDTGLKESLSGVEGIPDGFITSVGQIGNVADDMINNGGLSSGSLDSANGLLANSNAINNLNRRIQEDINKRLADSGLTQMDFQKEQENFKANLNKAVLKGLDEAKSKDRSNFMAALESLGEMPTAVAQEEQTEGEQLIDATSVDAAVAEVPSFQMPQAPKFDFAGEDTEFLEQEGSAQESALAYNENGEMQVSISEDYETSESSEIVSNKEVSIFRVISVRYQKSGIPRLIGLEE